MRDFLCRWPTVARDVEGRPIRVGRHELIPLVRVEQQVRRQASVGTERVSARGSAMVSMRPVAVRLRNGRGEWSVIIRDDTARTVGRLLFVAVSVGCLGIAVRVLRARCRGRSGQGDA